MKRQWLAYGLAALVGIAVLAYLGLASGALAPYLAGYDPGSPGDYEHTSVTVVDGESGEELGRVEAAVADSFPKRYVGLSETDALPGDRGMLFVHDGVGERTYVMRNMSFGLDILFVGADGTITAIHEAPEPEPNENGADQTYTGKAKYVLEVNRGWTTERGIEAGDRIEFEL
ncbi:DUF192 domain-containing protein [Natronomonas marina]|jgi:uncharacterized membrane protein (UPF0127 family)|uniref:DUF192 domain-containing protein n=1 Tax=Natronomonas marina TaxID=2961939 RepID=UPI0020C9AFCE|nr:DUF192 domain-containing protein [Natronomonas marina]